MTLMTGHCWHEEIMPRIKRGTDPLGIAPAYRQPSGTERHSWPEFPTSGYRRERATFLASLEEAEWFLVDRCQLKEFDDIHPAFPRFRFRNERLWPT